MTSHPSADATGRRSNRTRMRAGEWYVTDAEILAIQAQRAGLIEAYSASASHAPARR